MKLNSLSLWKRLSLASAFAVSGGVLAICTTLPAVHASSYDRCYHNCYSNYINYADNNNGGYYNNSPFFPPSAPLAELTTVYGGYSAPIATPDNCNSSYYHSYCYGNYDNNNNDQAYGDYNNNSNYLYLYPLSDKGHLHHESGHHPHHSH
ncbi:MAG TPA: hypothetical protein VNZ45_18870 [Bacteroidia bacterium]|nr:hypothetical protein [Bacteroidia bacterium]